MKKFVELRFGQGFFGDEEIVAKEIVPTDAIVDIYVVRPEMKSISIAYKFHGDIFKRIEFFKTQAECAQRYSFLKGVLGVKDYGNPKHGFLCTDADEYYGMEGEQ